MVPLAAIDEHADAILVERTLRIRGVPYRRDAGGPCPTLLVPDWFAACTVGGRLDLSRAITACFDEDVIRAMDVEEALTRLGGDAED